MKIKTSELTGAALDWAVAKCEGVETEKFAESPSLFFGKGFDKWRPSTDWAQGGPIIEREGINIGCHLDGAEWVARNYWGEYESIGHTALVAAMRCLVASRFGDEIEIPEELK